MYPSFPQVAFLRSASTEKSCPNEKIEVDESVLDKDGKPTGETVKVEKTVLRITVTHKTLAEIIAKYGFTAEQKEWLDELLKPEYDNFWDAVL